MEPRIAPHVPSSPPERAERRAARPRRSGTRWRSGGAAMRSPGAARASRVGALVAVLTAVVTTTAGPTPPAGAVVACSSSVPAAMEPSNLWGRSGPRFTVFANPDGAPPSVSAEAMDAAMQQAVAEWDADPASAIAITYGGLVRDTTGFLDDGRPVVFWRDLDASVVGTTSVYPGPFGSLAGFDTALNRDLLYGAELGGYDLTTTLRHELGHGIGLCHDGDPAELMYPSQRPGLEGVRGLTPHALAEVATQYPNEELTTIVDGARGLPTLVRTERNALFARHHNPSTDAWGDAELLGPPNPPAGVRFVGRAAVGRDPQGRLVLFVAGTDSTLYRSWQVTPEGGFVEWTAQFAGVRPGATIARNADGRLEVFAVGTDQTVRASWQATPGGDWVDPLAVTGLDARVNGLAAATNADGRVELFGIDQAGAVFRRAQVDAGRGPWSPWAALPAAPPLGSIGAATAADGRVHVFGITVRRDAGGEPGVDPAGEPGEVLASRQGIPGGPWEPWTSTGAERMTTGVTALVERSADRSLLLAVAASGADGTQAWWRRQQGTGDAASWTAWAALPPA